MPKIKGFNFAKGKSRSKSIDNASQSGPQLLEISDWPTWEEPSGQPWLPEMSSQSNTLEYDGGISVEKSQSELTVLKKDNDLKQAELVIVVMGPTGVGKSRLIKEATGENVPVGDSLKSCQLAS